MTNDPLHELSLAIASEDDERAEAAALAVGRLGDQALPGLREMLNSPQRDRRWWAARALAAVATPAAVAALIPVLRDPDSDVRACAVVGLVQTRAEAAIEPLVERLSDPSAYVARLVADGLAQFGPPAAAPLIGLGSHVLLDMIPHRDFEDYRVEIALWIAAMIVLFAGGARSAAIVICSLFAVLPDLENLLYKTGRIRDDQKVFPGHRKGLLWHGRETGAWSIAVQVAFTAAVIAWLTGRSG